MQGARSGGRESPESLGMRRNAASSSGLLNCMSGPRVKTVVVQRLRHCRFGFSVFGCGAALQEVVDPCVPAVPFHVLDC